MARPKPDVTVIERRERIRKPASAVFAFLDRPSNLKQVLPGTLAVSLEAHPRDLRPGTLFHYRLHRWPLDFQWAVVVSDYRPPESFTNVKATGYFPKWALEHEIVPKGEESELRMRLSYEVPNGIYATVTNHYVIRDAMLELVSVSIRAIRDALERSATTPRSQSDGAT
jgi:ligand-binding SRPBCC domain-containing protein